MRRRLTHAFLAAALAPALAACQGGPNPSASGTGATTGPAPAARTSDPGVRTMPVATPIGAVPAETPPLPPAPSAPADATAAPTWAPPTPPPPR